MMVVDVTALGEFASIKCIILTSNRVENLEFVKNLPYLQELYAASNNIKDIRQILYLQQSWRLFNVSFHSNPCSLSKNYRQYIIKALPQIVVLDGQNISTQDRAKSLKLQYDQRFDFFEEPTDLKQILKEHSLLKNTVSSIYKEEQKFNINAQKILNRMIIKEKELEHEKYLNQNITIQQKRSEISNTFDISQLQDVILKQESHISESTNRIMITVYMLIQVLGQDDLNYILQYIQNKCQQE
eukprot:EST45060.1 LRR domain-containing protein [Spironucleus salmonicida]